MFSITDWLNSPTAGGIKKPAPQPPPDPDPVLPAKVISIQWGKDQQQTVTLYMPARRASERVALVLMFHGGGWWQGDPDAPNVVWTRRRRCSTRKASSSLTGGYCRHEVHAEDRPVHGSAGRRRVVRVPPYQNGKDLAWT